jgi:hypothetical protein
MKINFEITTITVVNTGGADNIYLTTNLPNPIWPFTGNSAFKLESAPHKTDEFLTTNFPGVPVKKIRG